jgi:hypothetical protein
MAACLGCQTQFLSANVSTDALVEQAIGVVDRAASTHEMQCYLGAKEEKNRHCWSYQTVP